MSGSGDQFAGNVARWFWRAYDAAERAVVGGVIGWLATLLLLVVAGSFSHDLGVDGPGGDYAWYVTLPLGAILWSWYRRGRPGGWLSRAAFGFALAFPAGLLASVFSGAMGDEILGMFIIAIPAAAIGWPVLVGLLHPKPPPPEEKI